MDHAAPAALVDEREVSFDNKTIRCATLGGQRVVNATDLLCAIAAGGGRDRGYLLNKVFELLGTGVLDPKWRVLVGEGRGMEVYVKLAEIESFLKATREHIRSSRRNEPILGGLETYRPLIDSIAEALGLDYATFKVSLSAPSVATPRRSAPRIRAIASPQLSPQLLEPFDISMTSYAPRRKQATLRHSEAAYDARLQKIAERNARHAARERHEQLLLEQREADTRKRAREREEEQYAERWRKLGKARPGGGGGV